MGSANYDELKRQAQHLENRYHDVMENGHTQEAIAFRNSLRSFKEALDSKEDPSHLSDKVHHLAEHADRIKRMSDAQQPPMNSSEAHQFHQDFMRMRDDFRSM